MKFKNDRDDKLLTITDKDGDTLELVRYASDKALHAFIVSHDGVGSIGCKKAIKLALAILDGLEPDDSTIY